MNTYHLKEKAIQLAEESSRVQTELSETLKQLQSGCNHPHENIIQAPYKSGTFFNFEELRLCTMCGLQEERPCTGWKYIINQTGEYGTGIPLRKVTRDELFNIRHDLLRSTSVGISDKEHIKRRRNVRINEAI